jgi:uncharacterized membrane protein
MFRQLTPLERILLISVGFTLSLLAARFLFTREFTYFFYPWNLFLAITPYLFSRRLKHAQNNIKGWLLIAGWLLFFPNAPYLITDVFHFQERQPVPQWYDLILVISGAWNGLMLGIISLMQVEQFLRLYIQPKIVQLSCVLLTLLCGYGVYVGRYWRFNSWDVVVQPQLLFKASARSIISPHHNIQLWAFTIAFAALFYTVYLTLKQLMFLNNELNVKKQ